MPPPPLLRLEGWFIELPPPPHIFAGIFVRVLCECKRFSVAGYVTKGINAVC